MSDMAVKTTGPRIRQARSRRGASGSVLSSGVAPKATALLVFVTGILALELYLHAFDVSPIVFPTPSSVFYKLYYGFRDGLIIPHALVTFQEIVGGFVLGAVIGIVVAVIIHESKWAWTILYPYIIATQSIPKIAIAPLFLVWFGYGMSSKILLCLLMTFFPVLINTIQGLASADPERIRLLTAYGASRWQILFRVKFPSAMGALFAGLELAIVLSVIGAVTAEFVGADRGLGYLIIISSTRLDIAMMMAVIITLSVIGFLLSWLVRFIRQRVCFW